MNKCMNKLLRILVSIYLRFSYVAGVPDASLEQLVIKNGKRFHWRKTATSVLVGKSVVVGSVVVGKSSVVVGVVVVNVVVVVVVVVVEAIRRLILVLGLHNKTSKLN